MYDQVWRSEMIIPFYRELIIYFCEESLNIWISDLRGIQKYVRGWNDHTFLQRSDYLFLRGIHECIIKCEGVKWLYLFTENWSCVFARNSWMCEQVICEEFRNMWRMNRLKFFTKNCLYIFARNSRMYEEVV